MAAQDPREPAAPRLAPRVDRALIVEDDARLRRTLESALARWAADVRSTDGIADARRQLAEFRPELLLLDFMLPDGTAVELLASLRERAPLPAIIALSAFAEPSDSFELAELGVRAYLQKPIDLAALSRAVDKALTEPPELAARVRSAVGHLGLKEAEEAVRRTMVEEALERAGGNRRGAARVLGVSRELLQHILRKLRD